MPIVGATLVRYFGLRFLSAVLLTFVGAFALIALLDYFELMRRASEIPHVSALLVAKTSFYRVPQVSERMMPFCVLIGAMSCYLNLSRRLELVVARSAGMSAWQFISPALVVAFLLGILATTIYNPIAASMQERAKRYEAEYVRTKADRRVERRQPFWVAGSSRMTARPSSTPSRAATRARRSMACRSSSSMRAAISMNASRRARRSSTPAFGELLGRPRLRSRGPAGGRADLSAQNEFDAGTSPRKLCDA